MSTLATPGLFPGLGFLHNARKSVATTSNSSKSDALLAPLGRFIRRPANAIERLVEEFRAHSNLYGQEDKETEERKCLLRLTLRSAATLSEWQSAATELDALEGNNGWKEDEWSNEYNYELVKARLKDLEDARISCDAKKILFLIRTSLSRHLGGMGNLRLYKHSHIGTKRLIERYIGVALESLSSLLELSRRPLGSNIDSRIVLEQVVQARQAFGRSALLLSGGGTFGMNHIGVIKCLWETRLLPRIVSGASAGSIVCAVLCTRTDEEIPQILEEFCYGALDVFTDKEATDSPYTQITRFLKTGALFDISNLIRVMKGLLGDLTFQEAYNRTRRILNICVSVAGAFELPRLLNYITAPNVIIWSAVAASCSVPVVFTPADLLAKDPRTGAPVRWNPSPQGWIDGSVDNDLPMTRLAEMFNVNHFIVSQVNPHVVPFLKKQEDGYALGRDDQAAFDAGPGWFNSLAGLAKDEMMHRMTVLSEMGIFPNFLTKARSILNQRYYGDITILPEVSYSQLPRVLRNPDTQFMVEATIHGEKATWPKLSRIQNHCAIELALDDAVQALRARVAFSPSQIDLRLNVISRPGSRAGSETRRSRRGRSNRKQLRFSEEMDRDNLHLPLVRSNQGRPLSLHEDSSTPSKSRNQPATKSLRVQERRLPGSPKLRLEPVESAPLFSTGSEEEEEAEDISPRRSSHSSDSGTPSDEAERDYFLTTQHRKDRNARLFPHSSQPTTPFSSSRRSYFGSSSPRATSTIVPLSNLSMTTSPGHLRQYEPQYMSSGAWSQDRSKTSN